MYVTYFSVLLFIMLYKIFLVFTSVHKTIACDHLKESYVVLFITLYKVVLTFSSVDETLVCDHSKESY